MKKQVLILGLIIAIILSLVIGAEPLTFEQGFTLSETSWLILIHSRIPRTISIILAGGSMSMAGLVMQTISQNRFAAPSTVGTVEAAKLGVLLSLWLFDNVTLAQKLWLSFIMAVGLTLLFFVMLSNLRMKEVWTIPLFGMIYGQVIGSIASAIAYRFDLVQSIHSWQQGNFAMIQPGSYEWLWLSLIVIGIIWYLKRPLTIMQFGKSTAQNLGIHYEWMRYSVVFGVCLISAVNVMTVGILPFVGVIIPNFVRLFYSDSLRKSMPMVLIVGSLFVLICDLVARTLISPYEIPVSIVIAIIGGSLFLSILFMKRGTIR